MKAAKRPSVLAPIVVITLAWTVLTPVAKSNGHGQLGKPLEGLNMTERKLFRDGKEAFEEVEDLADGLGPAFNAAGCAVCHASPAVGGSTATNETRAARVESGHYFELPGGSLFQDTAINPNCKETIPSNANVIAKRQTTPLFGSGLIEAIPDGQIEGYAFQQARLHPTQAGRVHRVIDVASGASRVGRFGWKSQNATLLTFSGDAYVNEMGITNRLFPAENAPNGDQRKLAACDSIPDPEDKDDDIVLFTNFMRLLAPPPREDDGGRDHRGPDRDDSREGFWNRGRDQGRGHDNGGERGEKIFERVGCDVCHHAGFRADSPISAIDGQKVDAFSDFLLHDVGTGDGIIQGQAQGNEFRTPPLWGISDSPPYLHDGSAATIREAIRRHSNQGAAARDGFQALSEREKDALLTFLKSI